MKSITINTHTQIRSINFVILQMFYSEFFAPDYYPDYYTDPLPRGDTRARLSV